MAVYHVFVDGASDASSAGKEQLAAAIASHYGMPVADVRARIASGRFRVKGNCDRATADSFVRDLTALGARCSIEEATPANAAKTPLPFPAVTSSPQKSALPPRQTTPPVMSRTTSGAKEYQSGLAAAFSGEQQQLGGLGALEDGSAFKLSSVDGSDHAPPESAFGPPPEAVATPKAAAAAAKPAPKAADAPLDIFAPPDAQDDAIAVQLAPDEIERSAKKKATAPPENVPVERAARESLQAPNRASRPSIQPPTAPAPTGLREPKTRFVVGVVLAIAIGFIPAHLFASMREKSAYASIDANVSEVQKQVVTAEDYAALDSMRARQLERKHDERRNIAMISLAIWAAVGAGVAFGFFKKVS